MSSTLDENADGIGDLESSLVNRRGNRIVTNPPDSMPTFGTDASSPSAFGPPPDQTGLTPGTASNTAPGSRLPALSNGGANGTLSDEVTFLSGLNPDGTLAFYSFAAWNSDKPATYTGGYTLAMKWGADTAGTAGGTVSYYFDPGSSWSFSEKTVFAAGLALWSAEANIDFVETSDPGAAQITFTRGHDGGANTDPRPVTPIPDDAALTDGTKLLQFSDATISIDTSVAGFGPITTRFSSYGGYPWMTLLHEEGHAIGLGHAGPYNTTTTPSQQFSPYDTRLWSLMSYFNNGGGQYAATNSTSWNGNYPTTPMIADILAAQRLYGTPTNTPLSGGQVFGFNTNITGSLQFFFDFTINTAPVITLWDAGANNTLDLSGFANASTVNLAPGSFSSVGGLTNNLAIAVGTAIDAFIGGAGGDTVTANNDGDTIHGGGGNDAITGGSGNDMLYGDVGINTINGGGGNDTVYSGSGTNTINGGSGTDTVSYSGNLASYTVVSGANGMVSVSNFNTQDSLTDVEYLAFTDQTVSTASLVNIVTGNGNGLYATDGNDYISSSNAQGPAPYAVDYIHATSGVTVNLSISTPQATGGSGTDTLMGIDELIGSSYNDTLTGNANNNDIYGNAGDDTLNGGAGNDTLLGGAGTDTAVFSGVRSAYVLTNTGTGLKVSGPDGVDTLTDIEYLSFADGTISAKLPFTALPVSDFNGDGITDLASQLGSGQTLIGFVNGSSLTSTFVSGGNPGAGWHIQGTGDFDGDGKSDLVWQNASGQALVWLMNGAAILSSGIVGSTLGSGWNIAGIGDFNGDGKSDLLWQDGSGSLRFWNMAGLAVSSIAQSSGGGYFVKGVGDFNGDGQSDYLYQYANAGLIGMIFNEQFNGNGIADSDDATTHVAGVGDFNGDGYSDLLRQKNDGSISVWLMNGTHVISTGQSIGTLDSTWHVANIGDVNGDGTQDIWWKNNDGRIALWLMTGTNVSSIQAFAAPKPPVSDFNGDGKSDILWQGTSNQTQIWMMNGTDILSGNNLTPINLGGAWHVKGTGDFNGDGKSDILWQNSSGQTQIWLMNKTDIMAGNNLPPANLGAAWQVKGVGDFNGDGKSDILWQGTSGQTQIWMMNGTDILGGNNLPPANLGTAWQVKGVGDFNGDGKSDILWQNAAGQTQIWMMNGTDILSGNNLPPANLGTAWQVKGVGDFNGDGKSDILWQNAGGQTQIWMMNGTDILSGNNLPPANLGTAWQVKGVGDFNGDGKSDILWQNAGGQTQIWMMNGTDILSGNTLPPANLGTSWHIASGG